MRDKEPREETKEIVKTLLCGIVTGRNLTIASQYPCIQHSITGRILSSSDFFKELSSAARARGILVLEFDGNEVGDGDLYLPSFYLAKRALEMDEFSKFHKEIEKALKACEKGEESPWNSFRGGPQFVANIVRELNLTTLAILQNIHWELDDRTESSYAYGEETSLLGEAMSVAFDLYQGDDWKIIENHIHYFVDEMDGRPYLHYGKMR